MNTITISKNEIKKGGVVILPLKEYQKLREQAVPTYYLQGKEAKELDTLVEEGLKEYYDGKTTSAKSLDEALKMHGKKNKRS
ncbi:MAG: hypothetical protein G01um101429_229 [Parcubacteria group bacterium Gr01-1014_29]|nr:MAG: hypothetical protein G01um101429_229 [Parcubacteria group bacterium Gr01-1014_29]